MNNKRDSLLQSVREEQWSSERYDQRCFRNNLRDLHFIILLLGALREQQVSRQFNRDAFECNSGHDTEAAQWESHSSPSSTALSSCCTYPTGWREFNEKVITFWKRKKRCNVRVLGAEQSGNSSVWLRRSCWKLSPSCLVPRTPPFRLGSSRWRWLHKVAQKKWSLEIYLSI